MTKIIVFIIGALVYGAVAVAFFPGQNDWAYIAGAIVYVLGNLSVEWSIKKRENKKQ